MSVVNHKYQYIFFHVPHTGGRSVEAALMQHDGSDNFNGEHHIPVEKMGLSTLQLNSYTSFRVLRNPYDWLVTCWMRNDRQRTSFYEWAVTDGLLFKDGCTLFSMYPYYHNQLFTEELQAGMDDLCTQCNMPFVRLPVIGATKDKPNWRDLLTVSQAVHLEELYPDITEYGYGIFSNNFERG